LPAILENEMPSDDELDTKTAAAYGFAGVLLHSAVLQALVEKNVLTIQEVATLTAGAARMADGATALAGLPETAALAQKMLSDLAQSWAKRARTN
jgi:X-X-X-Leu-X-X-Gly heptad repeat protein